MQESRTEVCWVFSAYAEVVPKITAVSTSVACILRVRGGSSTGKITKIIIKEYSPRTRR